MVEHHQRNEITLLGDRNKKCCPFAKWALALKLDASYRGCSTRNYGNIGSVAALPCKKNSLTPPVGRGWWLRENLCRKE